MEEIEKPSFENFLSKPGNLSDHLLWQLGAISVRPPVLHAAQLIIGNLNEEGYLIASDEELLGIAPVSAPEADVEAAAKIVGEAAALGLVADSDHTDLLDEEDSADVADSSLVNSDLHGSEHAAATVSILTLPTLIWFHPPAGLPWRLLMISRLFPGWRRKRLLLRLLASQAQQIGSSNRGRGEVAVAADTPGVSSPEVDHGEAALPVAASQSANHSGNTSAGAATARARIPDVTFTLSDLHEALEVVRQFDPQGIACRDLRECLLNQLRYHLGQLHLHSNGGAEAVALSEQVVKDAIAVVDQHLRAVT